MAKDEIHVNDIGTVFELTIKDEGSIVNVSSATVTKDIKLKGPNGEKKTKAAGFKTDGTDGIITYTTVDGDLDEPGLWSVQGFVVLSGGTWNSDIQTFPVHENL